MEIEQGPMTGRAAGYCAGYSVPDYMNPFGGRDRGMGGRGQRNRFYATGLPGRARAGFGYPASYDVAEPNVAPAVTAEQELEGLKQQAENFQNALDGIKKRIEQLEVESKQ